MRVLQLIDSLDAGGAERVAVNIANALSTKIEKAYLCATRKEGLLIQSILPEVGYLFLNKSKTIDLQAIKRLSKFVKQEKIQIIHGHSTSFFLATLIKVLNPRLVVIWHDHYGNSEFLPNRKYGALKWCSKWFAHIFSVNKPLETWAKQKLSFENVSYLPNFAVINNELKETNLRGESGKRIVCLANLRPQKDHFTLFDAFAKVVKTHPEWTLHCIGKNFDDDYSKFVKNKVIELDLESSVFLYGSKPDVFNILTQCEIGVLSSKSEGLPVALLEYGLANLAVVATKVGECEALISNIENGLLVNPSSPKELADALILYIENQKTRETLAARYSKHIEEHYSKDSQIKTIMEVYKKHLK